MFDATYSWKISNYRKYTKRHQQQHLDRRKGLIKFPLQILIVSVFAKCCWGIGIAFHPKSTFSKLSTTNKTESHAKIMGGDNIRKTAPSDDAAVLRELKEIIQRQTLEISELKKSQSRIGTVAHTSSAGAHGAGAELSIDEISSYLEKPIHVLAQRRVFWLSLFLCSLSLTAMIMSGFEHTLSKQIELAYFVPLLAGHGGNTGGQTVGTVLSALSAGAITSKDAPRVIAKEALTGLLVGMILSSGVAAISYYIMGISVQVSTVIFCTIPLVSAIAATLGSSIPFLCLRAGLDPSVIAAPAMTSFVDVAGLMSYFLIANQIFRLFGVDL